MKKNILFTALAVLFISFFSMIVSAQDYGSDALVYNSYLTEQCGDQVGSDLAACVAEEIYDIFEYFGKDIINYSKMSTASGQMSDSKTRDYELCLRRKRLSEDMAPSLYIDIVTNCFKSVTEPKEI